jgi:glutathione synthase
MSLLFILDPLDRLTVYKDSSLAMMREAAKRGHALFVCMQHDVILRHGQVRIQAQPFAFAQGASWYSLGESGEFAANEFSAILMRKDPPFDNEYLYSTYLLELAQQQGGRVVNHPAAVRSWNEKLSIARFPQFAPEFLVTSSAQQIRAFLQQQQDIVVKPLDGMGGSSIFRLTLQDPNISVILETITQFGSTTIMAQRYLPAIKQGDKRVLVINGQPMPYALARIPQAGETRGNLAAGGTGVAQPLSVRDREIAVAVGQVLLEQGIILAGLDIIGDYLTEINVTSPTCMVEIASQTQALATPCDPASAMLEALESL